MSATPLAPEQSVVAPVAIAHGLLVVEALALALGAFDYVVEVKRRLVALLDLAAALWVLARAYSTLQTVNILVLWECD